MNGLNKIDYDVLEVEQVAYRNECDSFGQGLSHEIPYAYMGKRCDPGTGLVYFGKRYYDPSQRRWLTPDPLGPANHSNLYQYLFNSPYLYQDPYGEFAFAIPLIFWGIELAAPAITTCITALVYGAATGAVAYGGYKIAEAIHDQGLLLEVYKKGSVDPSLPANPDDLLKRPGWKETTHPEAGKKGHRTFENTETGERLRHDEGKEGEFGHKGHVS